MGAATAVLATTSRLLAGDLQSIPATATRRQTRRHPSAESACLPACPARREAIRCCVHNVYTCGHSRRTPFRLNELFRHEWTAVSASLRG